MEYSAEMDAVVLYADIGGTIGLRRDGEWVLWEHATGAINGLDDMYWIAIAAVTASEREPMLKSLVPARPPSAHTCRRCGGTGRTTEFALRCGECGGLGWAFASPD